MTILSTFTFVSSRTNSLRFEIQAASLEKAWENFKNQHSEVVRAFPALSLPAPIPSVWEVLRQKSL